MERESTLRTRPNAAPGVAGRTAVCPEPPRRRDRFGCGLPFSVSVVAAEIAAVNARLEAAGAKRRVAAPRGVPEDRENVSKELFLALRETRDRRLFDLVYRLNRPLVWAFCRNRVRRGPLRLNPIEILDDTFLLLWLRLDNFEDRPDSTFTGWVLAIAEHLALQAARMRRRDARRERQLQSRVDRVDVVRDVECVAEVDCPRVQGADWYLLAALCADGLERLPARWRRVVVLRDVEDRSYDEIASALAVSRGSVAMLLRRARRRLVEELCARLSPAAKPLPGRRNRAAPPPRAGSRGES